MKTEQNQSNTPPVIAHQLSEYIEHFQYFHEIDPLFDTELIHQTVSEQSNSQLKSNTKPSTAGITSRYHQNADSRFTRLCGPSPSHDAVIQAPQHGSKSEAGIEALDLAFSHGQPSPSSYGSKSPSKTASSSNPSNGLSPSLRRKHGIMVKGRSLYVRWKIPKRFQSIVGRTHFVRSLKTGRWADAVRMVRIPVPMLRDAIDRLQFLFAANQVRSSPKNYSQIRLNWRE